MSKNIHIKTIEDLFDIFEPYLTTEDVLEVLDELKNMKDIEYGERVRDLITECV